MIITGKLVTSENWEMTNVIPVATLYMVPPKITTTQRNFMVGGWGWAQEGRIWYNTSSQQWEMWGGNKVVLL